jgi:hypothetical protein
MSSRQQSSSARHGKTGNHQAAIATPGATKGARRGKTLATLLLDANPVNAERFIEDAYVRDNCLLDIFSDVIEPAARYLGDEWAEDHCAEAEMTLALVRLLAKAHELTLHDGQQPAANGRVVLGTPPSESHLLGCGLLSDLLRLRGFRVDIEDGCIRRPAYLEDQDIFVVCVSPALCRGVRNGWTGLVEPNPDLPLGKTGVYGRLADNDVATWTTAGADFACSSLRDTYEQCCGCAEPLTH